MSRVTFPCGEFNDSETEANGSRYRRFAEEVDFSPVEFDTVNVLSRSNDAGSEFVHKSGGGCDFVYLTAKETPNQPKFFAGLAGRRIFSLPAPWRCQVFAGNVKIMCPSAPCKNLSHEQHIIDEQTLRG